MMCRFFSVLVLSFFLNSTLGAVEARLPRRPAPSPDGTMIAFDWQGDLWLVPTSGGDARRLTANPADDHGPVWSRDGKYLAFASNRFGSFDVFVLSVEDGSVPKRLTFADRNDVPTDFSPDGTKILFSSARALSIRWMPTLWTVPVTGGTPMPAEEALGEHARYSPTGNSLLFTRGATKWTRHGYRGSASRTPWLRDPEGDYHRLSDFDGDEDFPCWINDHEIILLSSRSERKNIFRINLLTGEAEQLTHHENTDVRAPSASATGQVVAYEFEDRIWTLDLDNGTTTPLHIDIPADTISPPVIRKKATTDARDLGISPDGELAAFIVEGDLYITEIISKEDQEFAAPRTRRLTRTAAEESSPRWAPDGKSLLYASASETSSGLFIVRPDSEETGWLESFLYSRTRIGEKEEDISRPQWSPDGKHIAYISGKGDLMICGAAGENPVRLLQHWEDVDFSFSPDGKYIAYSTVDAQYNAEVWIIPSSGGDAYNVSRHPDDDLQPRWSPDGRRLLWISKRHHDSFDVWGVWLRKEDAGRLDSEWLEIFRKDKKKDKAPGKEDKAETGEKQKELPEVRIDFDGLWRRTTRLSTLEGDESSPMASPDGRWILFSGQFEGKRDLYIARWDGKKPHRLTEDGQDPTSLQFGPGGKTVFYLNKKGVIKRVDLKGKKGDPVPFTARVKIDVPARRSEVFNRVWTALDQWFYDPGFHGVDWESKARIYRPWALEAPDDSTFADVLNLMLGEINASHMGYYPPRDHTGEKTGYLGADFTRTEGEAGVLIESVIPDGPAENAGLKPGDRIISIDGYEIGSTDNIFELLTDTTKRRIPLQIKHPDGDGKHMIVVPCSYSREKELRYENWVRQRRELTEKYSENRLGYLHIHSMDIPSFETFERDLYAAGEGMDGLIIDVRSNGGGWTTDYLLAVLMVRRHAYTIPRDDRSGIRAYPQGRLPLAAWTRPAATLCNEDSYSNAEIFSHAFKTLRRGPVIGTTTFGAVISTSGQDLPDGGFVRTPMRGWYVANSDVNMENHGAVPDFPVAQPPEEDMSADSDSQLQAAVNILLEDIPNDPRHGSW